MSSDFLKPRRKAIEDDASRREYRVRFDSSGRILGHSIQAELSDDLGMTLDPGRDESVFEYLQRFGRLDTDLPERLDKRVRTLLEFQEEFSVTCDVVIEDDTHHLRISGQAIDNLVGDRSFTLLVLDDTELTHRRRMYEYMFRLANHEIKGPLSSIMGAVEYAEDHLRRGSLEGIQYCLEMITRNTQVIEEMIERYLNLSRIESGQIQIIPTDIRVFPMVLKPILEQMEPHLKKKHMMVQFECRGFDHEPLVHADPEKVAIVLRNLLSNAVKYGTAYTPIEVFIRPGEGEAEICVENQGPNIPEDSMTKLFERFVRLEATQGTKGSGLGLYNARKVVEMWGGRIGVASTERATRFNFTLPLASSETASSHSE